MLDCRGGGRIGGTTYTVLRFLSGVRPDLVLSGSTDFEKATVENWLGFCWSELEVLLAAVALPSRAGEVAFDASQVRNLAEDDVFAALRVLDAQLAESTFVASQRRATLADVALMVTVGALAESSLLSKVF